MATLEISTSVLEPQLTKLTVIVESLCNDIEDMMT